MLAAITATLIEMRKTDCFGETRLDPHVPSSLRAGKRIYCYHYHYHYYHCYYYGHSCRANGDVQVLLGWSSLVSWLQQ